MSKKFDPMWELLGEDIPLQGVEEDVDALCPICHVTLHVGDAEAQSERECGLCGSELRVVRDDAGVRLEPGEHVSRL